MAKCMPGATTRSYCLECKGKGRVVGYSKPMVHMECINCGEKWRTLSALCECCRLPSGSPYFTDCIFCKDKKKSRAKNVDNNAHSRKRGGLFNANC